MIILEKEWKDLTRDIEGTRVAFANIVDEIKGMNSGIGKATNAFKGLESLAAKLQYHQSGINRLSSKELEDLKKNLKPGPLSGIPIGIKDIINTVDFVTTNGSPIYAQHRPKADAPIVQKIRSLVNRGLLRCVRFNLPRANGWHVW
mgnify:CR=1 FL=1